MPDAPNLLLLEPDQEEATIQAGSRDHLRRDQVGKAPESSTEIAERFQKERQPQLGLVDSVQPQKMQSTALAGTLADVRQNLETVLSKSSLFAIEKLALVLGVKYVTPPAVLEAKHLLPILKNIPLQSLLAKHHEVDTQAHLALLDPKAPPRRKKGANLSLVTDAPAEIQQDTTLSRLLQDLEEDAAYIQEIVAELVKQISEHVASLTAQVCSAVGDLISSIFTNSESGESGIHNTRNVAQSLGEAPSAAEIYPIIFGTRNNKALPLQNMQEEGSSREVAEEVAAIIKGLLEISRDCRNRSRESRHLLEQAERDQKIERLQQRLASLALRSDLLELPPGLLQHDFLSVWIGPELIQSMIRRVEN